MRKNKIKFNISLAFIDMILGPSHLHYNGFLDTICLSLISFINTIVSPSKSVIKFCTISTLIARFRLYIVKHNKLMLSSQALYIAFTLILTYVILPTLNCLAGLSCSSAYPFTLTNPSPRSLIFCEIQKRK